MAGTFEEFGNSIRNTLSHFAESVSRELIGSISPIVYTGVLLYFFIRAYQITTGRAEGAIPDLITQCVKIVLVAFFGLNAGNFISYVIPAVYGIENMLLSAVSHAIGGVDVNNAWGAADRTWRTFMNGFKAIYNIWSESSWSLWSVGKSVATSFFILLLMGIMLFVSIYFMFFAVGYLLLYEIFLVMALAFGPLFICTLMFNTTRSWFDGWLRAVVCWAFTLVAVASTLYLINGIFTSNIDQISDFAKQAEKGKEFGTLLINLGGFAVLVLAIATVVKSIPTFAAGLTGGVALQAASVAGMLQSFGKTMAAIAGGATLGYAGGMYGREKANDTAYAKENRDALKSQAQHLLGSDGLTNPGSLASATAGYAAGAVRRFFTDSDKLSIPEGSESNPSSSGGSPHPAPVTGTSVPANMTQTAEQERVAAANAAAVGAAYAAQASAATAANNGVNATAPVAPVTTSTVQGAGAAAYTQPQTNPSAPQTISSAAGGEATPTFTASAPKPTDEDFDFSTDYSQFDKRAQFNTPSPAESLNTGGETQSQVAQELKQRAQARENERITEEIFKQRNKD